MTTAQTDQLEPLSCTVDDVDARQVLGPLAAALDGLDAALNLEGIALCAQVPAFAGLDVPSHYARIRHAHASVRAALDASVCLVNWEPDDPPVTVSVGAMCAAIEAICGRRVESCEWRHDYVHLRVAGDSQTYAIVAEVAR